MSAIVAYLRAGAPVNTTLPAWLAETIEGRTFPTPESRMRLAIELSAKNVELGTGGPFGSAIFHARIGELVAVGVNRVVPNCDPTAHGEMTALRVGAAMAGNFSLGREYELYTSAEPCGMCATAIIWGGVGKVYYGATTEDVEGIGYDEGLKPSDWPTRMQERGIEVVGPFLREQAVQVLQDYLISGGKIYNGDQNP